MRSSSPLAMLAAIVATGVSSVVGAAPERAPHPVRSARVATQERRTLTTTSRPARSAAGAEAATGWAAALPPVAVKNNNTDAHALVRLYDDDGSVDEEAARTFMRTAASAKEHTEADEPLDRRLVQLAFRASYHFGGARITVVSATRKGARGKHGTGEALDFSLAGVKASVLAAYLRTLPRVGVGIYTHPKTQYVHLDVRDRSSHWLDGSPPGVTWREKLLPDPKWAARDASWSSASDLPEAASGTRPGGKPAGKIAAR